MVRIHPPPPFPKKPPNNRHDRIESNLRNHSSQPFQHRIRADCLAGGELAIGEKSALYEFLPEAGKLQFQSIPHHHSDNTTQRTPAMPELSQVLSQMPAEPGAYVLVGQNRPIRM